MARKVTVQQDPDEEVTHPVLAQAIVAISEAMQTLLRSGLNERAIICLVQDRTGLSKADIRAVMRSLDSLKQDYTKR